MSPVLAFCVLALLLLFVGRGFRQLLPAVDRGAAQEVVLAFLAGAVAWHLLLQALTLVGVPWRRTVLAAGLLLLVALPRWWKRRSRSRRGEWERRPQLGSITLSVGWGDGIAALAVLVFALLAPSLWITTPDFVYHWGLKGEHAFLARGIDSAWLGRPWNWSLHPDYPHLLPLLYASTARLALRFDASTLQLWSALFLGGIVLAARAALREAGIGRGAVQGGVALVGLAVASYSIGYLMAGGAEGMMALALAAALPALLTPGEQLGPGTDVEIGLAAAFAAASKIEGVPLAAILIGVHLLRRLRGGLRAAALATLATAGPALAVSLPWFFLARRYHLFQASNAGPFDLARGRVILPAILDAMNAPELHGLPWVVALLPLLVLVRRTRPLAVVLGAQLAFYVWVYFASVLAPRFYVLSNFARLLFHLLPAVLVGLVIALAPREGSGSGDGDGRWYPPEPAQGQGERSQEAAAEKPRRPVEQIEIEGGS